MKKPNITKEILDFYFDQDFVLIPINRENGKRPLHRNWTERSYSRSVIENYVSRGYNLGFQIPKNYCVVDVDPKHGGEESFERLCDLVGLDSFAECPSVHTGGHELGRHYYFRLSTDQKIRTKIKEYPGIEFKTQGQQVIIPGSVHPDTKEHYVFGKGQNQKDIQLPKEVIDLAGYSKKESTKSQKISNDQLREILCRLPIDEYADNDAWFAILAAAHSATSGAGIDEFLEWSLEDPNYSDDEQLIRLRWDSLQEDIAGGRTLGTLIQELLKHGSEVPMSISAQEDFADDIDGNISDNVDIDLLFMDIEQMSEDSTEKDLEKIFCVLNNLDDNIVIERALKALKIALKIPIQNVRNTFKKYKEKQNKDIFSRSELIDHADLIASKILKTIYNDGKHLIHATNQQFYSYNGRFWEQIKQNIVEQIIYKKAKEILKDSNYEFKVSQVITNTEKILRAKSATKEDLLRFEKLPPSVVNTLNFELWINDKTGKIIKKKHNYKSYLNYCIDIEFDISAKCPIFDQALDKMFCNAKEPDRLITYLWEIFGYIIQSKKNLACWFLFHGHGDNGKSFVIDVLCKLLGSDMILPRNIAEFGNNNNAHALASLPGKLLILDDDLKKNITLPDGILKKLSEAKRLESNPKGKEPFNFMSVASPVLLSNHWPVINDVSKGFMRRINVVPFCYELKKEEIVLNLIDKISGSELQGVLNKALIGLQRLRRRERFDPPRECREKIKYWMGLTNPVIRFITTCCIRNDYDHINIGDLYDEYLNWSVADRGSTRHLPIGQFEELLQQRGFRVHNGMVRGLRIVTPS